MLLFTNANIEFLCWFFHRFREKTYVEKKKELN